MTRQKPPFLQAGSLKGERTLRHGFFTREGGVSEGIYASLNARLSSDDARKNVLENRRRIAAALGAPVLLTPWQHHSATCAVVEEPWDISAPPKADALATRREGLGLAVATADCTPVLFADAEAGVVAAAHAGWKGAIGGVLEETLDTMERLGARRGRIRCAIGPTISQAAYEVGPEFRARFEAADAAYARFFAPSRRAGHFMFDLPGFVAARLRAAGAGAVEDLRRCTCSEEESFFSYRRNTLAGVAGYGCQLSAIMLVS